MIFRTIVDIDSPSFRIEPCEDILFVGSCFADNIGKKFKEEGFNTLVNPYGVMYNPASVLHTIEKIDTSFQTAIITLGTNHVYIDRNSDEIVDNCQKRPQSDFVEKELTMDECESFLAEIIEKLKAKNAEIKILFTVSPIRYAKYGYHRSQLSKAVLLLSIEQLLQKKATNIAYFPAYEIVNDELRDYRFYKPDMLHPNEQAIEYIWERFVETHFSNAAKTFLAEWKPVKAALAHRPFSLESQTYKDFKIKVIEKIRRLKEKYPNLNLEDLEI